MRDQQWCIDFDGGIESSDYLSLNDDEHDDDKHDDKHEP